MKALLVIWADPAWHPTVRHTAQMLSERGYSVRIVCKLVPSQRRFLAGADFGAGTRLVFGCREAWGWRNRLELLRFILATIGTALRVRPDCIVGYDLHGIAAGYLASRLTSRSVLVYHNFDLSPPTPSSPLDRLLRALERRAAHAATATVVSSRGRAVEMQRTLHLAHPPLVVNNTQRLRHDVRSTGELTALLQGRGLRFDRLVVRLGSLVAGNAIEATVESVTHWTGPWGLVLAGQPMRRDYVDLLHRIVSARGLENRVVVLPDVPLSLWHNCLASADLGIALYEPSNINNRTMAGAGNKLNLYLSAGIPAVVPDAPDFREILDRYPLGETANPLDPVSIGRAVNAVLSDGRRYAVYARAAREAFVHELNFEVQFEPVLTALRRGPGREARRARAGALSAAGRILTAIRGREQ